MIKIQRAVKGFTLLEVLVAFVILALILGSVLDTFHTGLKGADVAGDYAGAVVRGQSKLAALGISEPLIELTSSGEFDSLYRWRMTVEPVERVEENAGRHRRSQLSEIHLTVFWGEGASRRELNLRTYRYWKPSQK